jgi:hypothetical protein
MAEPSRFAWTQVLRAVERDKSLNRRLLMTLAEDVFPAYRAVPKLTAMLWGPETLPTLARSVTDPDAVLRFIDALDGWCRRWWLLADGFKWLVMQTLLAWTHNPELARRRQWFYQKVDTSSFHGAAPWVFSVSAWHPLTETWHDAEERILRDVKGQLQEHRNQAEKLARQWGAEPVPTKTCVDHVEWFVRYQVKGEKLSHIAKVRKTDRTAVSRAVEDVGRLLDGERWDEWRRPKTIGRPKKG